MIDEEFDFLVKQKATADVIVIGYMMFLSDKKLLTEAQAFVSGFASCLSKEEFQEIIDKNIQQAKKAVEKNDTDRSTNEG